MTNYIKETSKKIFEIFGKLNLPKEINGIIAYRISFYLFFEDIPIETQYELYKILTNIRPQLGHYIFLGNIKQMNEEVPLFKIRNGELIPLQL